MSVRDNRSGYRTREGPRPRCWDSACSSPGKPDRYRAGAAHCEGIRCSVIHKGLVLNDQGDSIAVHPAEVRQYLSGRDPGSGEDTRNIRAVDEVIFDLIDDQIGRGRAVIDIQARNAPCMVVKEEQPGALLVGIIKGPDSVVAVRREALGAAYARNRDSTYDRAVDHVRDVLEGRAFLHPPRISGNGIPGNRISRRRPPLMRRAVADTRGMSAMEVNGDAVLSELRTGREPVITGRACQIHGAPCPEPMIVSSTGKGSASAPPALVGRWFSNLKRTGLPFTAAARG